MTSRVLLRRCVLYCCATTAAREGTDLNNDPVLSPDERSSSQWNRRGSRASPHQGPSLADPALLRNLWRRCQGRNGMGR